MAGIKLHTPNQWRIYCISALVSLLISVYANADTRQADKGFALDLARIDTLHHSFSSRFHKNLIAQSRFGLTRYRTVKALEQAVNSYLDKNQAILAASLIIKNTPMLKNNYDNLAIFSFIDLLLDKNEWKAANVLYEWIKQEGDRTLVSNTSYIFAKYSFRKAQWVKTLNYLRDSINDLPGEEYHHALLIQGISLQNLKKHRTAIHSYEKIPDTSMYYVSAMLNMAIANIRQGWWTDGHILITSILNKPEAKKHEEAISRLYLTLGYSFLNQEYYRNSRDAFRSVGTNNSHTNSALLGISLSAANQEDYIGALNAVRILKEKKSLELPVDEAYLLMPYYYEKLQQHETATSGYTEAVNYYQNRIKDIKKILHSNISVSRLGFSTGGTVSVSIENNPIIFSSIYPDYFIENYLKLRQYPPYLAQIDNAALTSEYEKLLSTYESTIETMIRSILKKRIEHLNSYMDQCRFGLARLYDNNLVAGK